MCIRDRPEPIPCKVKLVPGKIRHKSCVSQGDVKLASCSGACQSTASFKMEAPFFQQDCSCCRPTEFEDVEVPMFCLRKRSSALTIKRIKKCVCSPCNEASVLPTEHPSEEKRGLGKEEDSKERKRRSITDIIYNMFVGN